MKLGFYYHIPLSVKENLLYLPGYLAVFINALAKEVEQLTLFLHESHTLEAEQVDTELIGSNIAWVNLGKKTSAWHRSLFFRQILKPIKSYIKELDFIIVRGPSPLAPCFKNIPNVKSKIVYLVVGDYKEGVRYMKIRSLRDLIVKYYTLWNDRQFRMALRNALVIVNSRALFKNFLTITPTLYEVRTTTLSESDFFQRNDSSIDPKNTINILFTGRIVKEKGLENIIAACRQLYQEGILVHFNIAGMLVRGKESYIEELQELAIVDNHSFLTFHGFKKVGNELNKLYRKAQIYILASVSDFEGFPRTLWEAMANSCPVIATRVGSIPEFLEHEKHALLITPRNVDEIVHAIIRIINDSELRNKIVKNGQLLAKQTTLELQTKKLVNILYEYLGY